MNTPIIIGIIHIMIFCCWRCLSSAPIVPVILVVMNIEAPTRTGRAKFSGK